MTDSAAPPLAAPPLPAEPKTLDASKAQKVSYCIPIWLRDEQIKLAIARDLPRIQPHHELREEPCAIVCYGPSLNDTWEKVKDFAYVFSCSGSHKFLVEKGIIPTYHVEVDPRAHKVQLIGEPHPDVEYLIASTCHPAVFDHLKGFKVTLWHVFDNAEDGLRTLPSNEWALTGGCGVGLRVMTIARFLGFTEQHIFGMDGNQRSNVGKHAAAHPMQAKDAFLTEYMGKKYWTTPAFLEAARMTFHELNMMPDVKPTFYGEGLVQHMFKHYVPEPVAPERRLIGFNKPELITPEFRELNARLHREELAYGVGGAKHADTIKKLVAACKCESVLDYGCGKGYLAKSLPFPIWEYDPAIPEKDASPRPADLVVCLDVLEHIEPDKLQFVLDDLRRCVKKVGYFTIHIGPAQKHYADGRNTHLIQQPPTWWEKKLNKFFEVGKMSEILVGDAKGKPTGNKELHVVVGPKHAKAPSAPVSPTPSIAA